MVSTFSHYSGNAPIGFPPVPSAWLSELVPSFQFYPPNGWPCRVGTVPCLRFLLQRAQKKRFTLTCRVARRSQTTKNGKNPRCCPSSVCWDKIKTMHVEGCSDGETSAWRVPASSAAGGQPTYRRLNRTINTGQRSAVNFACKSYYLAAHTPAQQILRPGGKSESIVRLRTIVVY